MKILKKSRLILLTLSLSLFLFTCFTTFSTYATSNELVINTEDSILGKVYYSDFSMIAKKITSSDGLGYCLEIDKNYPHGESFKSETISNSSLLNILACGYPNKTPSDLNLTSENDAYFATQIAIWSFIEGYDVSKITGDRPEILNAINTIYNNSLSPDLAPLNYDTNLFFYSESIQDIIILSPHNNELPIPPEPTIPDEIPEEVPDEIVPPMINGK